MIEGLYNGDLPDDESDAENDASSIAYEVWTRAKEEDPTEQRALRRYRIWSTRFDLAGRTNHRQSASMCGPSGISNGFGHFNVDSAQATLMTGQEALRYFECSADTPALPLSEQHFPAVKSLVLGPLRRPELTEGRLRVRRPECGSIWTGSFASMSVEAGDALDALYRRPLTLESETRLKNALGSRDDDQLSELLVALHSDSRLVIPDGPGNDPIRIVCSMGAAHA